MKVLIVDDESHVRDAIQLLLEWEKYGFDTVLTADNVEDAINILQDERPELLIVDVVIEDVFGMDIMNYINDQNLNTKAVVISGHDDFQYVRAMFILGAVEYLLKPIEQDKLEEAVLKAVSQMKIIEEEEKFTVDKQFKRMSPDYQHGLLRKLFRPELADKAYEELVKISQQLKNADRSCILHCSGSTLPIHEEGYLLKLSRFVNRIQDMLESEGKGAVFQNMKPSMDIVILIYGTEKTDFSAQILELKKIAVSENCVIHLGASSVRPFPLELENTWEEAKTAADHISGTGIFITELYRKGMSHIRLKENLKLERAMYSSIILGNIITFEEQLNLWTAALIENQKITLGIYRNVWDSFLAVYKKWVSESDVLEEELFSEIPVKNFGDILSCSWKEIPVCMTRYFILCAAKLIECRKHTQNISGLMAKIEDFLELNYMKKISQQEIADYFHVNKDYLSRAFKKHMGIGMAKYLNNIRIENARELLSSSNLTVAEIADQVGYFDAKYFSRQFKLACSMTPAQYRQKI